MFLLRGTAAGRLNHAADTVTAWAGDPTGDQGREGVESRPGKARRETHQQRLQTRRKGGVEQVGIFPDAVEVPRGVRAETISVRGVVAGSLGGEGGGRRP